MREQRDDEKKRDRNAEQPKQNVAHDYLLRSF
jgi:hypothetical protein